MIAPRLFSSDSHTQVFTSTTKVVLVKISIILSYTVLVVSMNHVVMATVISQINSLVPEVTVLEERIVLVSGLLYSTGLDNI